jgi:hypothetical protein
MNNMISSWRPSWWSDAVHGSAWDRAREAMRRDWSQTRHDLGVGGHEMNQSATDTINQASARQHLPTINEANPGKVVGEWEDAEIPYRYGYAARSRYGAAEPEWTPALEAQLKLEWMTAQDAATRDWESARRFVRRGYELAHTQPRGAGST